MAQTRHGDQHLTECGHVDCHCMIDPSQHFCSDYCAKSSPAAISGTLPGERHTGEKCRCGHPDCT